MICIIFKELLKDFSDYILTKRVLLTKREKVKCLGKKLVLIYFFDLGYSSLREFIVYIQVDFIFRRVPAKAEGEIFRSPVFVSIYISDMQHCHAVLKVPSLTVTDE